MEYLKLVGSVVSVWLGVFVIIKLFTGKLDTLITAEKEQREKGNHEIKEEIERVNKNITRLYDTKVDKELCIERCKK